MNESIYQVLTPVGTFQAVFGEEYTPVEYRGDDLPIGFFRDFIEINQVSGEHGHRISYNTLEPDELYGFCQPNGSGITVIPPFDDMLAFAREELMEHDVAEKDIAIWDELTDKDYIKNKVMTLKNKLDNGGRKIILNDSALDSANSDNEMNPQSFTIKGMLAYQIEIKNGDHILIRRAVQQSDGTWWKYVFYKGKSVGAPVRSKKDQPYILEFVNSVRKKLGEKPILDNTTQVLDNVNVTGIEKIKLAKELNAIRGLIKAGTMSGLEKLKSVKRLNEIRVIFGGNVKQVEFDPTSAEGYSKVMVSTELQEYWQDVLDSFFQGRIVDVRNALRDLGWTGRNPNEARLYKNFNSNDAEAQFLFKQVGAGANVVGYSVNEIADDLTKTPEQFALEIDSSAQHEVEIEPEQITPPATEEEVVPELTPEIEPEVIAPEHIAIDPIIEPEPVIEPTPVSSNPELDKQMAKLANLTRLQEQMKAANKILKSAKLSDEQKQSALSELGYDVGEINKLMRPDFAGRIGYSYHLTNNNAVIKNTQKRIEQLQEQEVSAMKAESGDRETSYDFDGGNIELSYADDRLRVNFDKKPASDMIVKLKQNGFKWSPTNTAWQRQLTDNAILAANSLFGTKIQTAAKAMQEEQNKPSKNGIVAPVVNETTETQGNPLKAAFEAELNALKLETNIPAYDKALDDIMDRIEKAGLSEELDIPLNLAIDKLTDLMAEAEKKVE